jgi:hypothetical protein
LIKDFFYHSSSQILKIEAVIGIMKSLKFVFDWHDNSSVREMGVIARHKEWALSYKLNETAVKRLNAWRKLG